MAVFSTFAHRCAQNCPAGTALRLNGQLSVRRNLATRRGDITALTLALTAAIRRDS
jgi:hypothetical protein